MGKLFTEQVGKVLTRLLGNYLTAILGKVLDIYIVINDKASSKVNQEGTVKTLVVKRNI